MRCKPALSLRQCCRPSGVHPRPGLVALWYARASSYVWAAGPEVHRITQAGAVFSLGIAPALSALQHELREGEHAVAYLDDICLLCQPDRVVRLYQRLEELLWEHARLSLNAAKTRVWNQAGIAPPGIQALGPDSTIWVGDQDQPEAEQGLLVLGVPFGAPAYVDNHLSHLADRHGSFLQALPGILNRPGCFSSAVRRPGRSMPSACCPPRPQQGLLPPISSCLAALLYADLHDELPALAVARAQLALRHGGLGLRSAARHATAAFWVSWADSLRAIAARAPGFADRLLLLFESQGPLPPALDAAHVAGASLKVPAWRAILNSEPGNAQDDEPALDLLRGWQRLASRAVDDFLDRAHRRELSPGSALRLPLPLSPAFCRCRQRLDVCGDRAAACPRSGLLRARGMPLERAAARVCREAGATVTLNTLVRDLNVDATRTDDRRIEVITNGMLLWGGPQLAVGTTLVSALTAAGAPRRHAGTCVGAALYVSPAKPKNARTPSCGNLADAGSLSSALSVQAAGARKPHPLSASSPAAGRALRLPHRALPAPHPTSSVGWDCLRAQPPVPCLSFQLAWPAPVSHSQC